LSLWQELDGLQKKKAELDGQLASISDREKAIEERLRTVEDEVKNKEDRVHTLEVQLKERDETVSDLESRIADMENMLKKPQPVKEPVDKEPAKEENLTLKELMKETTEPREW